MKKAIISLLLMTSFVLQADSEFKTKKLNFEGSTIIVSDLVHSENGPLGLQQSFKEIILNDITCSMNTPTYYYELNSGCSANMNGDRVELSLKTSAILFSMAIDSGDATGSLYTGFQKLECKGGSRSSSCILFY